MTAELLQALNDQLNREVSTFLRYMLQAASIRCTESGAETADDDGLG